MKVLYNINEGIYFARHHHLRRWNLTFTDDFYELFHAYKSNTGKDLIMEVKNVIKEIPGIKNVNMDKMDDEVYIYFVIEENHEEVLENVKTTLVQHQLLWNQYNIPTLKDIVRDELEGEFLLISVMHYTRKKSDAIAHAQFLSQLIG